MLHFLFQRMVFLFDLPINVGHLPTAFDHGAA